MTPKTLVSVALIGAAMIAIIGVIGVIAPILAEQRAAEAHRARADRVAAACAAEYPHGSVTQTLDCFRLHMAE
jgi:hypothetical protein